MKAFLQKHLRIILIGGGVALVFFAAALFMSRAVPGPIISAVEPSASAPLGIYPVFNVTFTRTPTQDQKERLTFVLSPGIPLTSAWQKNTVVLTPAAHLAPGSQFTLSILYENNPLFATSYTTTSLDQLKKDDEERLQTELDFNFNQSQKKLLEEKPWLNLLPVTTKEYTVVYDFDLQKIRIRLKAAFTDAQKRSLLQSLSGKGIPTGSVVWIQSIPTPAP